MAFLEITAIIMTQESEGEAGKKVKEDLRRAGHDVFEVYSRTLKGLKMVATCDPAKK